MVNISDYNRLIDDCYLRINNYERQISGVEDLLRESKKGAEQFSLTTAQRRRNIMNSINGRLLMHPMESRLNVRLSGAIDTSYENNVLSNFQSIEEDILEAIRKIESKIEDEKNSITSYQRMISDIEDEERKNKVSRDISY